MFIAFLCLLFYNQSRFDNCGFNQTHMPNEDAFADSINEVGNKGLSVWFNISDMFNHTDVDTKTGLKKLRLCNAASWIQLFIHTINFSF